MVVVAGIASTHQIKIRFITFMAYGMLVVLNIDDFIIHLSIRKIFLGDGISAIGYFTSKQNG